MGSPIDITVQVFGRLTAVRCVGTAKTGGRNWECLCICGNTRTAPVNFLRSGHIQSCGCLQPDRREEAVLVHGHNRRGVISREYKSWNMMLQRCTNQNYTYYHNYGGRGITVCERWRDSFAAFYEDMGERPTGMSLDRINNDGNYEPGNCKWSDSHSQLLNTRRSLKNRVVEQLSLPPVQITF